MSEFDSLVGKVKRLEERHRELLRLVPKLEKTKDLVEAEVSTLRHHAANVKEKFDRLEERIAQSRDEHNLWIKQTQDELTERELALESETTRRDSLLDDRQQMINTKKSELDAREKALEPNENRLRELEKNLCHIEIMAKNTQEDIATATKKLEKKRVELNNRETQIDKDRAALEARKAGMAPKLEEADALHEKAKKDRLAASELLKQAKGKVAELDEREIKMNARQIHQDARDNELNIKDKKITDRQEVLTRNLKHISSI